MTDGDGDRLGRAVGRVVTDMLAGYGHQIGSLHSSHRGSSVEVTNGATSIVFAADWLEGELEVTVQTAGGDAVPAADLVDLAGSGVSMRRIGRRATVGMIEQRLRVVVEKLIVAHPSVVQP